MIYFNVQYCGWLNNKYDMSQYLLQGFTKAPAV